MKGASAPAEREVEDFLSRLHGVPVRVLEPLHGGFWSAAYGYEIDGRELVLRLGADSEGYEMDRAAMEYARPGLPIPAVLEIGTAFGGAYAISERYHGRFLETVRPEEASVAGPTIVHLLDALRAVPHSEGDDPSHAWRAWLRAALVDDPSHPVRGWRPKLAADPALDRLFRACESRVDELIEACPERRDLIHGDLLHANVLVAEDASRVNAVFSWKCSTRGDFLYDVAWCTFWGPWHPGIDAADVLGRAVQSPVLADDSVALADAPVRHHCYELVIGANHMGWNAWRGDEETQRAVSSHTAAILERGPLPLRPSDSVGQ